MLKGVYICGKCHATQFDRMEYDYTCQYCGGIKELIHKERNNKPPLGIEPRYIHDEKRKEALIGAILRYIDNDMEIPVQWIEEYNDICKDHPHPKNVSK